MFNPEEIKAEWTKEREDKIKADLSRYYKHILDEQEYIDKNYKRDKKRIKELLNEMIENVDAENWGAFHDSSRGPNSGR
jgi:hypothetical protein